MKIDRIPCRGMVLLLLALFVGICISPAANAFDGQTTSSTEVMDVTQITTTSTTTTTVHNDVQLMYLPETRVLGNTPTSKKKKFGHSHNITVGSGPGFDYASIQDALDNAPDGATIRVAEGTYAESIFIQKEVKLLGARHKTDPGGNTDRGGESVIQGDVIIASDGATVSGFKLDGYRIIIAGAQHVTVSYNIIMNTVGSGAIHIGSVASGFSGPSHHARILHNAIFNAETYGIFNVANDGVLIKNNHIENTISLPGGLAGNAIDCANHAGTGIRILNNTIIHPEGKGINYWAGPGVVAKGNNISLTGDEAVFTDTVADIKDNIIDGSDKLGISLYTQNTSGSKVRNNMVLNCRLDGIWIEGDQVRVKRNEISGITYAGINVRFGTDKVSIHDNDVSFSGTGVDSYGKTTIRDNEINQCGRGVTFFLPVSFGSKVIKNKISHIAYDGIWINAEDILVSRNNLHDVVYAAITIRSGADNVSVTKNSISSNGTGVEILGSSIAGNKLDKNEFDQNTWGIRLIGADQNLIQKNEIEDSAQVGILLDENSSNNRIIKNEIEGSGVCDINDLGFDNIWENNDYETACHLAAVGDAEEEDEDDDDDEEEEEEDSDSDDD